MFHSTFLRTQTSEIKDCWQTCQFQIQMRWNKEMPLSIQNDAVMSSRSNKNGGK